ncbi:MAG TPA: histidine phosphatase family protein [Stellaceae bacterium]|nr:histidine phosphatase family protein [Stellaceae bacterium]
MPKSPTIFLVRHGETEWNRARRYQGWSDSPLTPRGVAQAEAVGRRLNELPEAADAGIIASPLGRASRTAAIIAECLGRRGPPRVDERLREISLGSWDGRDRRDIRSLMGAAFAEYEWYFATPDGERYDGFAGRIGEFLAGLGDAPVIVVCHGVVTRVLRGLYAGMPRAAALRLAVPQDRIFRLADGRIDEIAVDPVRAASAGGQVSA